MIILDIFSTILTAISAFLLVGLAIALAVGYILYRAFQSLPQNQRSAIILLFFLVGIALMITVIGIEVGLVLVLIGAFVQVFQAIEGSRVLEQRG